MRGNHWLSVVYSVMHCKDLSKSLYFIGARLDRINEQ
jgi:hypothetical protein